MNTNRDSASVALAAHVAASLGRAARFDRPFRHFFAEDLLPAAVVDALAHVPVAALPLAGLSGRREYHNDARCFFNAQARDRFPIFGTVAAALQSDPVVAALHLLCAAPLAGTFLRIEYAADGAGFWLEPHTDLGVKKLTCFISLAKDARQSDLGTDLYKADGTLCKRVPFLPGAGVIFVPGSDTWHGFAPRPMPDCRRSLIVNFVGPQWRSREQLAFPELPAGAAT